MMTRRKFLLAAAAWALPSGIPRVSVSGNAASASYVKPIPIDVPWRSVIHLTIADTVLKRHITGFLDLFERSVFSTLYFDSATKSSAPQQVNGQDYLKTIRDIFSGYRRDGFDFVAFMRKSPQFARESDLSEDKLNVVGHRRAYDNKDVLNGCATFFASYGTHVSPVAILMGQDYLSGIKCLGIDNKYYPESVDAVMAHELTHVERLSMDEKFPIRAGGIVGAALGGMQRHSVSPYGWFSRNGNGGYVTLYDKQVARPVNANVVLRRQAAAP
ncbi:MAG: hypothetical protein ABTQ34_09035 [Bdellovibrionales bacterium]